jgi:hypothetical protein
MDERRFDDLTRTLGHATTRRQVLKGLLGGLAAALVPALIARDAAPAAAAPPPTGSPPPPCDNASQALCDERAHQLFQLSLNSCLNYAGRDAYLAAGCRLAAGDLARRLHQECRQIVPCDAANCQHCTDSGCQPTCIAPATCNGSGGCVCPNGLPACNGQCPDLQTDPANCGACGHACPAGSTCVAGVCCVGAGGTCATTSDCCFGQCTNGKCCLPDGGFCGSAGECCSGICTNGQCGSACTTQMLTIRGQQCCLQPPASYGLGPTCGPFVCAYAVTGTGPGGCDLWCAPGESAGCGPDGQGGRECCCTQGPGGPSTVCVPD